jgi:hypothetical protein
VPASHADSGVSRCACTSSLFVPQDVNPGAKTPGDDAGSVIGRSIIDDDNFHLSVPLAERAFDSLAHQLSAISRGNYN